MKLKVKARPTEKLHFKLGFPNRYLNSFKARFSVTNFPVRFIEGHNLKDSFGL